jgi:superfamily II DNA or RNA helicase
MKRIDLAQIRLNRIILNQVSLLGMTATPERTDGNDIFQLFDHNIAYEIRLNCNGRRNVHFIITV